MNRSEAFSCLSVGERRFKASIGLIFRGSIRRAATQYYVDYYEEKGFLESIFVFRGKTENILALQNFFKDIASSK